MFIAKIREIDCVGCAKCLPACPVDAIVGTAKFMHSVITEECIGCKLCVAPCPMDCIEIITLPDESETLRHQRAKTAKKRYQARTQRKISEQALKITHITADPTFKEKIRVDIDQAVKRVAAKKAGLVTKEQEIL